MMTFKVNTDDLAYQLAQEDNLEQAEFFNRFSRHFKMFCHKDVRVSEQLQAIADHLTDSGKEFIKALNDMIILNGKLKKIEGKDVKDEKIS